MSVNSPQTILQSSSAKVAPGGWTALSEGTIQVKDVTKQQSGVQVELKARQAGTARVFVWDGNAILAQATVEFDRSGSRDVWLPTAGALPAGTTLLVSYQSGDATTGTAQPLS